VEIVGGRDVEGLDECRWFKILSWVEKVVVEDSSSKRGIPDLAVARWISFGTLCSVDGLAPA